ncbi:MAG TPA: metalloregulator ArsR/SmtB family transcription factor [Acidobacteriota bacterium]|nr:metalloregulator ArsR/SmtB family transcription factor [Acidobacteriota bacterium]
MLKVLGHPVRLRIVEELDREGELPVRNIVERVGELQGSVSQHLTRMKALGLLQSRREGTSVFYSIAEPQVSRVLDCVRDEA